MREQFGEQEKPSDAELTETERKELEQVATEGVHAILASYGYERESVAPYSVLILNSEEFEEFVAQNHPAEDLGVSVASYNSSEKTMRLQKEDAGSSLRYAHRFAHEFVHHSTMPAEAEARANIEIVEPLLEGLISNISRRLHKEHFLHNGLFAKEIAETNQIIEEYPNAVANECKKRGLDLDDLFMIRQHFLPDDPERFTLELRSFSRGKEYRIVRALIEAVKKKGKDPEQFTEFLFRTVPQGDIEPLKQELDSLFGAGTFTTLTSLGSELPKLQKAIEALG